jgi:hypothetical protein
MHQGQKNLILFDLISFTSVKIADVLIKQQQYSKPISRDKIPLVLMSKNRNMHEYMACIIWGSAVGKSFE